jgi:hypothetical protein
LRAVRRAAIFTPTLISDDADAIRCRLQPDERIVTTQCNSCLIQRLVHEKRTCCSRSTRERYEIVACKSLTTLWRPALGKVATRCLKRITDLPDLIYALPLDDLPVLVIDELEALRQKADAENYRAHDPRERRRADYIHEKAIASLVGFVD